MSPETDVTLTGPWAVDRSMSPEAVWMFTPPPISRALKSELALLTFTPPETRSMSRSPEAVCTFRPPSVPRVEMSADLVRTDRPESCGQRMRHSMPLRPKIEIENPFFCGTSTRTVGRWPCGLSSTRALSTSRCDSSSCAISSISTRPSPLGSTSMSPLARRTSSSTGPWTSNVFCTATPLALGVALKALAGDVDGSRLGGPRDRAHEPGVDGHSLALSRLLDRALERLGEAQADPRRKLLAGDAGGLAGGV